ncbi:predicted protein [Postia placenta Mad-698-R]|nr:predicted protein [Postia placenta Mad-698-R]
MTPVPPRRALAFRHRCAGGRGSSSAPCDRGQASNLGDQDQDQDLSAGSGSRGARRRRALREREQRLCGVAVYTPISGRLSRLTGAIWVRGPAKARQAALQRRIVNRYTRDAYSVQLLCLRWSRRGGGDARAHARLTMHVRDWDVGRRVSGGPRAWPSRFRGTAAAAPKQKRSAASGDVAMMKREMIRTEEADVLAQAAALRVPGGIASRRSQGAVCRDVERHPDERRGARTICPSARGPTFRGVVGTPGQTMRKPSKCRLALRPAEQHPKGRLREPEEQNCQGRSCGRRPEATVPVSGVHAQRNAVVFCRWHAFYGEKDIRMRATLGSLQKCSVMRQGTHRIRVTHGSLVRAGLRREDVGSRGNGNRGLLRYIGRDLGQISASRLGPREDRPRQPPLLTETEYISDFADFMETAMGGPEELRIAPETRMFTRLLRCQTRQGVVWVPEVATCCGLPREVSKLVVWARDARPQEAADQKRTTRFEEEKKYKLALKPQVTASATVTKDLETASEKVVVAGRRGHHRL